MAKISYLLLILSIHAVSCTKKSAELHAATKAPEGWFSVSSLGLQWDDKEGGSESCISAVDDQCPRIKSKDGLLADLKTFGYECSPNRDSFLYTEAIDTYNCTAKTSHPSLVGRKNEHRHFIVYLLPYKQACKAQAKNFYITLKLHTCEYSWLRIGYNMLPLTEDEISKEKVARNVTPAKPSASAQTINEPLAIAVAPPVAETRVPTATSPARNAAEVTELAEKLVLIVAGDTDYSSALKKGKTIASKIKLPFSDRGLVYDKAHGLHWPDEMAEEAGGATYVARRYNFECGDGGKTKECLTIEDSSAYKGMNKGYFIVVEGIYDKSEGSRRLKEIRKIVKDAYLRKATVFMGSPL